MNCAIWDIVLDSLSLEHKRVAIHQISKSLSHLGEPPIKFVQFSIIVFANNATVDQADSDGCE